MASVVKRGARCLQPHSREAADRKWESQEGQVRRGKPSPQTAGLENSMRCSRLLTAVFSPPPPQSSDTFASLLKSRTAGCMLTSTLQCRKVSALAGSHGVFSTFLYQFVGELGVRAGVFS